MNAEDTNFTYTYFSDTNSLLNRRRANGAKRTPNTNSLCQKNYIKYKIYKILINIKKYIKYKI